MSFTEEEKVDETLTEEEKVDRTLISLVERLNAGQVIPDEDLVGLTLKYPDETYADNVSDLLVASAGKPGQGILTRIDPNLFKEGMLLTPGGP